MDETTIAHFSLTLNGAKNIYRLLRDKEIPYLEALQTIDDRIIMLEDYIHYTKYQCTECKKRYTNSSITTCIDDRILEAIEWFYNHNCRRILNLRRK